eukprot:scaffold4510_cov183-Amphora_coffeaeformis.AAC.23
MSIVARFGVDETLTLLIRLHRSCVRGSNSNQTCSNLTPIIQYPKELAAIPRNGTKYSSTHSHSPRVVKQTNAMILKY